jgi:hypothetical protein
LLPALISKTATGYSTISTAVNIRIILTFLIVVSVLLTGMVLPAGTAFADERSSTGQAPPLNETTTGLTAVSQATSSPPQVYTVVAANSTVLNETQLATYGETGVQVDARIEVKASPKNVTAIENVSWVNEVRPATHPEPVDVPGASDGTSLGVEQLHQRGIAGENVKVGIIDDGFDSSNPTIQDNIVETQSYTQGQQAVRHGTSVAEVVTRTAPESELYLASTNSGLQTERAIDDLIDKDVDIIVASWGYLTVEDDGDHFLTDEINRAQENDVLFVVAAGNYAQTHWQGDFRSTDGDSIHEWIEGDELNCLPNCNSVFAGGQIDVYLRWEDGGQPSEYQAALYNPVTEEYIAATVVRQAPTNKYAVLSANIQRQPVDLVVANTAGPADDNIEVIVIPGSSAMQHSVPGSSIAAPGDVPSAFTVAAYEAGQTRMAPYSSRGPTDDGRLGIDITGYTNINVENGLYGETPYVFAGTSAAAPYVGGVAALIEDEQGRDTSVTTVARTLRSSSDDILRFGDDTISGAGVVNAQDALNGGDVSDGFSYANFAGEDVEIVFQGQDTYLVGEDVEAASDGDSTNLQRVDSFDEGAVDTSSQVEQLDVESQSALGVDFAGDLAIEIETDDLDADDYFVRGAGNLPVTPDQAGTFEVTLQDLSIEFDDAEVTDSGEDALTDFDVDSNRGRYDVNISADGDLNDEELYTIFTAQEDGDPAYADAPVVELGADDRVADDGVGEFNAAVYHSDEEDADEKIVLTNVNDRDLELNFTDTPSGEYNITADVVDTSALAETSIQVEGTDNNDRSEVTVAPDGQVNVTADLDGEGSDLVSYSETIEDGAPLSIVDGSSKTEFASVQVDDPNEQEDLFVLYFSPTESIQSDTVEFTIEADAAASPGDTFEISSELTTELASRTDTLTVEIADEKPSVKTYRPAPGEPVDNSGVVQAILDWRNGEISNGLIVDVVVDWQTGQ